MLIGEAPGANEEKTGKVFSGLSGQLLDAALKMLGIQDDVFITNANRCRPPGNRTPKPAEIRACRTYLLREIDIIRPKVIVTLGRTAAKAIGLDKAFLDGTVYKVGVGSQTYSVLVTFHPAYCLRMGKQTTLQFKTHLEVAEELSRL